MEVVIAFSQWFCFSPHQEEQSKLESRCEDLQKQNTLLHEQIQTLSGQMASQLQRVTSESPLNVSLTEEGKSQEQLLEILRSFFPPICYQFQWFIILQRKCQGESLVIHDRLSFLHGLQICATGEGDCRVSVWGGPGWESEAQAESGTSGERAEGCAGEFECREREDAGLFGEPRCILFYYWSTVLVNYLSY